ncbi:carbohydrate porin [Rhodoblastus sp.]|uniref:carbohydrate porin n=1 Tax=Rhodoblastus sp. TaxID=1962975 RepID=UPI003F9660E5
MRFDKFGAGALISTLALAVGAGLPARAADLPSTKAAPEAPVAAGDPWSGFYVGGSLGYGWGVGQWSGAGAGGSYGLANHVDTFNESGSFLASLQGGYNYLLPQRVLLGVEADLTFPAYPQFPDGYSTGGVSGFASPTLGTGSYGETLQSMGTLRGRIGYAPGNWLIYATGGLAWARNTANLSLDSGLTTAPAFWRLGWAAGAGVEFPILPHWTANLEYLYTGFGAKSVYAAGSGESFNQDFNLQSLRFGVNYHFGGDDTADDKAGGLDPDRFAFRGQATFTEQIYGPIHSTVPDGVNSLPASGMGRETFDTTLYAGVRLWQGAEFWANPEIDQGFGVGNTHGVSAFPSGESYKLGYPFPYARVQRYFVRQEIDLGGEKQKIEADQNIFANEVTSDRLVFTVGKFAIVDLFDTNKYANNPKGDFLNWASINTGTFDYAGDAWGYTYGAAAEWYKDRFTVRGGLFDLSAQPAEGYPNGYAYGLDQNFSQFEMVGELEERHELWGQAGKVKVTGFLSRGRMGEFQWAADNWNNANFINTAIANNTTAAAVALGADRQFRSKPGVSLNIEQGVTESVGVFLRAGLSDGKVEAWDFTDTDRVLQVGVSVTGKDWGRPDDTWGLLGILGGLDPSHAAYFNAGGLGILVGDGQSPVPTPGLLRYSPEKVLETYYSYALTSSVKLAADYQFVADPGFNANRGPANLFAVRVHWQF